MSLSSKSVEKVTILVWNNLHRVVTINGLTGFFYHLLILLLLFVCICMNSMEYRLSKFKNDMANQFGHNVYYNNVLMRVFYYLLEKRINTRILFLMTTHRRVLLDGDFYLDAIRPANQLNGRFRNQYQNIGTCCLQVELSVRSRQL